MVNERALDTGHAGQSQAETAAVAACHIPAEGVVGRPVFREVALSVGCEDGINEQVLLAADQARAASPDATIVAAASALEAPDVLEVLARQGFAHLPGGAASAGVVDLQAQGYISEGSLGAAWAAQRLADLANGEGHRKQVQVFPFMVVLNGFLEVDGKVGLCALQIHGDWLGSRTLR